MTISQLQFVPRIVPPSRRPSIAPPSVGDYLAWERQRQRERWRNISDPRLPQIQPWQMAATFDNGTFQDANPNFFGVTTITSAAFTIGAGSNRAAVVYLLTSDPTATVTSVTLGGVSGVLVSGADTANVALATGRVRAYAVINPPSGSQTASATVAPACNLFLAVITVANCDQTTPCTNGTNFQANSTTATSSVSITSASGDLTSSGAFSANAWGSSGGGAGTITSQTLREGLGTSLVFGADTGPGTGTTTHTWSDQFPNQEHAIVGVNFLAAAGGSPRRFLLVGH